MWHSSHPDISRAFAALERGAHVRYPCGPQIFTTYECRSSADRGVPHPGDIAEPASLSAIPLPPSAYPLWDALPPDVVASGKLSQLQVGGVGGSALYLHSQAAVPKISPSHAPAV